MVKASDFTIKNVTEPKGPYVQVYKDHWWWCKNGDPTKAIVYKETSPQCNRDKSIVERIGVPEIDDIEIVFISVAFLPINPTDYC